MKVPKLVKITYLKVMMTETVKMKKSMKIRIIRRAKKWLIVSNCQIRKVIINKLTMFPKTNVPLKSKTKIRANLMHTRISFQPRKIKHFWMNNLKVLRRKIKSLVI